MACSVFYRIDSSSCLFYFSYAAQEEENVNVCIANENKVVANDGRCSFVCECVSMYMCESVCVLVCVKMKGECVCLCESECVRKRE